jgi:hypothetical protein
LNICTHMHTDKQSSSRPHTPGRQNASSCVPEASSRQMKGVKCGTPGGALPPLTPTLIALMPFAAKMGMTDRDSPGTSLCVHGGMHGCGCGTGADEQTCRCRRRKSAPMLVLPPPAPTSATHQHGRALVRQPKAVVQRMRQVKAERQQRGVVQLVLSIVWVRMPCDRPLPYAAQHGGVCGCIRAHQPRDARVRAVQQE